MTMWVAAGNILASSLFDVGSYDHCLLGQVALPTS